jgi:small ligand-binding sensory domain FIST
MPAFAKSFEVRSASIERTVAAFVTAREQVAASAAGILFASGALLDAQTLLARRLAEQRLNMPILVVGGRGVLSERGEIEGQSAATGLVWSGDNVELGAIDAYSADDGLAAGLESFLGRVNRRGTVLLFIAPGGFSPRAIHTLGERSLGGHIFGGGSVGNPGVVAISAGGDVVTGRAIAMALGGLGNGRIRTSYACRLLGPLRPITKARGALVLKLGDEPALDVLTRCGKNLEGQPLVFTVLSRDRASLTDATARPEMLVRGVQGIDPEARGLLVSDEVKEGMLMGFGVKDASAAREDLTRVTRELSRDIAGAAPRCALYVNCGGRGAGLYGRPDVDTRILRQRFGNIPIAGMQSSFEIAPHGSSTAFQLYTGVVSLFCELS